MVVPAKRMRWDFPFKCETLVKIARIMSDAKPTALCFMPWYVLREVCLSLSDLRNTRYLTLNYVIT